MGHVAIPSYRSGFYTPKRGGIPKYPQLWRGCVGAWCPSLGPTGLRLMDQSLYGNHGTLTNMDAASDWVVSGGRGALDFDGVDDNVLTTLMVPSTPSISIVVWVYPTSAWNAGTSRPIVGATTGTSGNSLQFLLHTDNNFYIGYFTGTEYRVVVAASAQNYVSNQWQMYTYVATIGQRSTFYRNSELLGTSASNAVAMSITEGFRIGAFRSLGSYTGAIAESRFYNRVLTTSEIKLLSSRPGIAYELDRQRNRYAAPATGTNRRRRIICGASV